MKTIFLTETIKKKRNENMKTGLCLLTPLFFALSKPQNTHRSMHSELVPSLSDKLFLGSSLAMTYRRSQLKCAEFCLNSEKCVMFAFRADDKLCALYGVGFNSSTSNLTSATGMRFYYLFQGWYQF